MKRITLITILILTAVALVTIGIKKKNTNSGETAALSSDSVFLEWQAAKFENITTLEQVEGILKEATYLGAMLDPLTEEQIQKAHTKAAQFIISYKTGRFADFKKFAAPTDRFTLSERAGAYNIQLLEKLSVNIPAGISPTDPQIMEIKWNSPIFDSNFNKKGFTGYMTGIAPKSTTYWSEVFNSKPSSHHFLDVIESKRPNHGAFFAPASFVHSQSLEYLLKNMETITFIYYEFLCKLREPEPAISFVLIQYWNAVEKEWIPHALVGLLTDQRNTAPLF